VESGGKIYDSGIDIIVDGAIQSVTGVGHAWLHLAALCLSYGVLRHWGAFQKQSAWMNHFIRGS